MACWLASWLSGYPATKATNESFVGDELWLGSISIICAFQTLTFAASKSNVEEEIEISVTMYRALRCLLRSRKAIAVVVAGSQRDREKAPISVRCRLEEICVKQLTLLSVSVCVRIVSMETVKRAHKEA